MAPNRHRSDTAFPGAHLRIGRPGALLHAAVIALATVPWGDSTRGPRAFAGDEPPSKAPAPDVARGKRTAWKSADGLVYEYVVPKDYDAKAGVNLTFILHGSNLDHRWGFANHEAGTFRADDLVVCPDGTTSNGKGGFNFLQGDKDLKRLHALQEELRKAFKVRATYVYGHSQGSFFSFLYAGAYPDDVQGVLGQASGVWIGTEATPKHHHQAIALMHGTADPVVPYGQSVGGLQFYRDAKYPLTHLRSLEGWNHWPEQFQAGQELAWCEGMSSADPVRVAAALAELEKVHEHRDPSAYWQVADRLRSLAGAPSAAVAKAKAAADDAEALAKKHVDAIEKDLGKDKGDKLVGEAWVAHLPTFLRDYDGVPACEALRKTWADRLEKHKDDAVKHLKEYYRKREKDVATAFTEGVAALQTGFLHYECAEEAFLESLEGWAKDAKKNKLTKAQTKAFDETVPVFRTARKKGLAAYQELEK